MTDTPESDIVATETPIEELTTPVVAPAENAPPSPPEPPKKDWRDQELGQTRRLLEAERQRVANLEAENRRAQELLEAAQRRSASANDRAEAPPPPSPSRLLSKDSEEFKAAVRQEAAQLKVQQDAQVLIDKLRADYADHEAIANNFQAINDDKGVNSFALLFEAINVADDPAYITAALGRDPARIRQLVDMTPAQRAYAVARLMQARPTAAAATSAVPAAGRPSDAPPPPSPAPRGGSPNLPTGQVELTDKRLEFDVQAAQDWASDQRNRESDAAWYAERERQKRESKGRPWSVGGTTGGRH